MPWFKLDDSFMDHPKVVRAGPDATLLFIAGGLYCCRYLTDGLIPAEMVPRLTPLKRSAHLAGILCAVELWHELEGFYRVHDYLDYNPPRAEAEREAEARSAKAKRAARARWDAPSNAPSNAQPMLDPMLENAPSPYPLEEPDGSSREIAPKGKRKERPRDPIFDALETVFPAETPSERALLGKVAAELKDAKDGNDPDEVVRRGNLCLQRFDQPSAAALAKHWTSLGATPAKPRSHFDGLES